MNPTEKNNLMDISEFIKREKKMIKQSTKKKKKKIFTSDLKTENGKERDMNTLNVESGGKKQGQSDTFQEFYKSHCEEMKINIDDLTNRNKELEAKIQDCSEMEKDLERLTIEELKFKKFKKFAYEFPKKLRKECMDVGTHENKINNNFHSLSSNGNEGKLKCENPFCIANIVTLIELQKSYDKLLIENGNLKRENYKLKNQDIV